VILSAGTSASSTITNHESQITNGRAFLRVTRSGTRSVASRVYATSPLRLLTPRNHGHASWIYTSSFGGGLVDGDSIRMHVDVGAGAAAMLSTQASTKVYRSPRGTAADLHAQVAADGVLVVLPDPVVCFAGSRYRQQQRIDLNDDAALVLVDWVTAGRHTAGERWAFAEYRSELIVAVGGRPLVHDVVALREADGDLAGRMGRFNVLALIVVVGATLRAEAAAIVEQVDADPIVARADQLIAATPLDQACVVRIAGVSLEQVARSVRSCLAFLPGLLGDSPWNRKW
jgi:urease accessory protein